MLDLGLLLRVGRIHFKVRAIIKVRIKVKVWDRTGELLGKGNEIPTTHTHSKIKHLATYIFLLNFTGNNKKRNLLFSDS